MGQTRERAAAAAVAVAAVSYGVTIAAASAAPVIVNGASFDAPSSCAVADTALVCKEDGQQLELWVYRKPLAASVVVTDSLVRKMASFNDLHENAVANIMRSTGNDKVTPFATYGSYVAVGSAMAGKGEVAKPTARFASVLHGEEVWQFLEVVAKRTPAIDALTAALQRSLVLPALPAIPATSVSPAAVALKPSPSPALPEAPAKQPDGSPLVATFIGKLLSLEHPGYLSPVVIEDTADRLQVNFKHKTRATAGPNLLVTLGAPKDKLTTAASMVKVRKEAIVATMIGRTDSMELTQLGAINGAGFALVGTPNKAKGLSGTESLETTFVANIGDRVLEVRLTAEQQYSSEARVVWSSLASSITVGK